MYTQQATLLLLTTSRWGKSEPKPSKWQVPWTHEHLPSQQALPAPVFHFPSVMAANTKPSLTITHSHLLNSLLRPLCTVAFGQSFHLSPLQLRRLKWNMSWHWLCLMNPCYIRHLTLTVTGHRAAVTPWPPGWRRGGGSSAPGPHYFDEVSSALSLIVQRSGQWSLLCKQ